MGNPDIVFTIFLIFVGAAVFSTVALFTRQSMLVAYILLGVVIGPWGFKLVADSQLVYQISDIGIVFLLFLLGLHLHPQNLARMLSKVTLIALISSLFFAVLGFGVAFFWGFTLTESLVVGAAMMFSSTIIGLKLLPASVLHNQHTGELMISVLLMQDLIAIVVLMLLDGTSHGGLTWSDTVSVIVGFPVLILLAFLGARYVVLKLFERFEGTQEYIFLVSIAWCLGFSQLAEAFGLSENIGAFVAGVALATSPIAFYIAESLKPLRDFFLILFFFAVGAGFDFHQLNKIAVPAIILAGLVLVFKPIMFYGLLRRTAETKAIAAEVGLRLGQASEFSILIATFALSSAIIGEEAAFLIYGTTILTFLVSSYIVVWRYPTPMMHKKL